MAPYRKYGFRISRILEVHGIQQTRDRIARTDALTQCVRYDHMVYDASTPFGKYVMESRKRALAAWRRAQAAAKRKAEEEAKKAKKANKAKK